MRYFCLGNAIALVKLTPSPRFFNNLPYVGVPLLGKLPVTRDQALSAYKASQELILCKSLDDANKMRYAKISIGNTNVTPEFFVGAIAQGYPLGDYAIYEVEVDDAIEMNFSRLNEATVERLNSLVSSRLYFNVLCMKDRSALPTIEICVADKAKLNPKILDCHYLSLEDGRDEIVEKSGCSIM